MTQLHQKIGRYLIISILFSISALAQLSFLSQIQDTVYSSPNVPFNGTVVITWTGGTSTSGVAPFNVSVRISNGVLSVLLAPSTNITPVGYYQAVYNSNDGLTSWTETWAVPPSSTPLILSQVKVTNTTGTGGTGSGGTGGGGSNSQIQISQVVGLSSDLNAIDSSLSTLNSVAQGLNLLISNLTSTVTSLSNTVGNLTSGATNANFVDSEIPGGSINGLNTVFTLANTPALAADVTLYRNGILQANGMDYTLAGNTVTFSNSGAPQTGDELLAYYRIPGTGVAANFADDEIPTGTIDGTNVSFLLANTPTPTGSLKLFKNGTLLQQGVDYTVLNQTVTFVNSAATPVSGDSLCAYYRITILNPNTSASRGESVPARPGH